MTTNLQPGWDEAVAFVRDNAGKQYKRERGQRLYTVLSGDRHNPSPEIFMHRLVILIQPNTDGPPQRIGWFEFRKTMVEA